MPSKKQISFTIAAVAALVIQSNTFAHAAEVAVPDVEMTQNGVQFACTGIAEARDDPKWEGYPLKVVFASKNGQFIGRVRVTLESDSGHPLVDVFCLTPWFVARVPQGDYQISAWATNGAEKSTTISVPADKQKTQHLHFPDGNY